MLDYIFNPGEKKPCSREWKTSTCTFLLAIALIAHESYESPKRGKFLTLDE